MLFSLFLSLGLSTTRPLPPGVIQADGTVQYFAFGSNLLASKMDGRAETEVLSRVSAVVADHRLAFNMRMFPPLEPAMARRDARITYQELIELCCSTLKAYKSK